MRVWNRLVHEMQKENMKTTARNGSYALSDFYLASYLVCRGLELIRTDPAEGHRVLFVLKDSPNRQQLIQDFFSHRAQVDPLDFKDAIVNLKSMIHGVRNSQAWF